MAVVDETFRRKTLSSYRSSDISNFDQYINEFAFNGFYWTKENNRDIIACAFCTLKCFSLNSNETNPFVLHLKYNIKCPLVNNRSTNNKPAPENISRKFPAINEAAQIGYVARYPEYANHIKREDSYKNWPKTSHIRANDLVDSGFFYLGEGDKVTCFACGLGLMQFEKDDVPMEEHKTFANNCDFLKRTFESKL